MRIEEAFKHYREGSSIRRKSWEEGKKAFELYGVPYLTRLDVEAQDWEVVRKKVAWPEAWEALRKGKVVAINDPNTTAKRIRLANKEEALDDINYRIYCWYSPPDTGWYLYGNNIPVRWLYRTDFEIIEGAE